MNAPTSGRLPVKLAFAVVALLLAGLTPAVVSTLTGGDIVPVWIAVVATLLPALAIILRVGADVIGAASGARAAAERFAAGAPVAPTARADAFGAVAAALVGAQERAEALRATLRRLAGDDAGATLPDLHADLARLAAVAEGRLKRLGEQVNRLAQTADRASAAVGQVSDGAQAQHEDLDLVATAIGQTAQAIFSVSDSTRNASDMVKAATGFAAKGKEEMARLLKLSETIAENSRRIGRITEAITQIAVKTNILSVNASIEAARAGEQGKGFEVVAEEVGKLADNAVESARQIREIVEAAARMAEEGMSATGSVVRMMDDIADRVAQVDRMFHSIAVAMEEQQSTIKDIEANVFNIRSVASGNANASEQIAATMAELVSLADATKAETARLAGR